MIHIREQKAPVPKGINPIYRKDHQHDKKRYHKRKAQSHSSSVLILFHYSNLSLSGYFPAKVFLFQDFLISFIAFPKPRKHHLLYRLPQSSAHFPAPPLPRKRPDHNQRAGNIAGSDREADLP